MESCSQVQGVGEALLKLTDDASLKALHLTINRREVWLGQKAFACEAPETQALTRSLINEMTNSG